MKTVPTNRPSLMMMRSIRVLTPLALCMAFILGCGRDQPATQYPASLQTSRSYTPAPVDAASPRATPPVSNAAAESPAPLLVPTPTPGHPEFVMNLPPPPAPSLDENILHADVIAWVRPPTVTGKSKTIASEDGVAPTYRPFIEFQFEVVEYLKGSGGSALTVESSQSHTYLTDKEALSAAADLVSDRNTATDNLPAVFSSDGDDREAVIFLRLPESDNVDSGAAGASTQVYYFESSLRSDNPFDSYNTDAYRKSWLPADAVSSEKSVGASQDSAGASDPKFINSEPMESAAEPSELTLEYLRSRVKAVAAILEKGEGIEGYEECVAFRFAAENQLRASEKIEGKPYTPKTVREGPFVSGLPAGSEFRSSEVAGAGYVQEWYEGRDADLFQVAIVVDGADIVPDYFQTRNDLVGYEVSTRVTRPLPSGTYEVKEMLQTGESIPCNFHPDPDLAWTWIFTFESPDGTLHEAFFDPAAMGGGAGADKDNGVLKPAEFSLSDGSGASLRSVSWQPSAVEMRLEPHTRLAGYHANFIALDGSIALRLDFDDASETGEGETRGLSWPVCVQPWQAGDLLMLRLSENPAELPGVTRDTGCAATPAPDAPMVVPATPTPNALTPVDTPTAVPATATPAPVG